VPTTITSATDTVLATDRTNCKYYNVAAGGSEAVTLPQAGTTGFDLNFVTCMKNIGLGKVRITPTTSTIDGNANLDLWPGDSTTIYSDNANYSTRTIRTTRICSLTVGTDDGAVLTNTNLGPQGRLCPVPENGTIIEIVVAGNAGTPNVIVGRNRAGSIVNLTSAALATAAVGAIACSNANGVAGRDGTTCTNTLQNTAVQSGDWLELVSGTAGGTAARMSIDVYWTSGR
jgi:hypothetical protein